MKIVVQDFYKKCIFVSIINAIMALEFSDYSSLHSWDGNNYSFNDWQGIRGTVTFNNNICVAACRNEKSKRLKNYKPANSYFKNAPQSILGLAEDETLQYLLENIKGQDVPLITAAFWVIDGNLVSIDKKNDLYDNGIRVLDKQLFSSMSEIIENCVKDYRMSKKQIDFANYLFDLKIITQEKQLIYVKKQDFPDIFFGLDVCEEGINSLKETGIILHD